MAEKLKLYVHIGQPKTGSSAIQAFLNYNREKLAKEYGILYPNFHQPNFGEGFYHNHGEMFVKLHSVDEYQKFTECFIECQQYCHEHDINSVIISWEGFKNELWPGFISLIEKTWNTEVIIILYLRRQDLLYESSWKQWGHKYPEFKTIQDYIAAEDKNHLQHLKNWFKYFTPKQFIVRTFEKSCIGDDVVTDFLKIIGIKHKAGFIEPPDNNLNVNEGLKPEIVEILRLCNNLIEGTDDNKLLDMMSASLSDKFKKQNPFTSYGFLTLEERKKVLVKYEASNREVAKIFFGESRENLFLEPLEISDDDPDYFTGLTLENTVPVFMELMLYQADQIRSLIKKNIVLSQELNKIHSQKFLDLTFVTVDLKEFIKKISFESQITGKRLNRKGFEFTSTGNDPAFIFTDYPTFANSKAIQIEITTPATTNFQIFFTSPASIDFVEKNSVVKLLPEGRSRSIFYFPEAIISGKLRIDPGNLPGRIIIHQLEIGY